MDLDFSEEQDMLRDMVRGVCAAALTARVSARIRINVFMTVLLSSLKLLNASPVPQALARQFRSGQRPTRPTLAGPGSLPVSGQLLV